MEFSCVLIPYDGLIDCNSEVNLDFNRNFDINFDINFDPNSRQRTAEYDLSVSVNACEAPLQKL